MADDRIKPSSEPSLQASYPDLFHRLTDGALLLDPESYEILEANYAWERLWGENLDSNINQSFLNWINPDKHDELKKIFRVSKRRYYPRVFEITLKDTSSKSVVVEIQACSLRLKTNKDALQIIVRDITARKKAEQQVQQLLSELKVMNLKLESLSITDEMTGLYNFRFFKIQFQKDHERSLRSGLGYSIVFFDIDYFKKYNDRNGHPAGDTLLSKFAQILKNSCRTTDFPARYGGEEFVIICADSGPEDANVLAERVRKSVENTDFEFSTFQPTGAVTVSVGVSSFPEDGPRSEDVLAAADKALYYSKKQGRNQVTLTSAFKKAKTALK